MIRLQFTRLLALLILVVGVSSPLSAQAVETYIFAGGTGAGNAPFDGIDAKIRGGSTYGFKVGGFLSPGFELDGNVSWYNHFALSAPKGSEIFRPVTNTFVDPEVRGLLLETSGTWNFGEKHIGGRFAPYITLGVGGMRANIKNADEVFVMGGGFIRNPAFPVVTPLDVAVNGLGIPTPTPTPTPVVIPEFIPNPARQIVMEDGDWLFTFSYGGGVKFMGVWGPLGFRVDVRGRTIPNFYSQSVTRPEGTGGLIFTWGER
jgi:opacity protein-like surface antigen